MPIGIGAPCGRGYRVGGLSLARKLKEQHDSQTCQQIKHQQFIHLLSDPSLPALEMEATSQRDLRIWTPDLRISQCLRHQGMQKVTVWIYLLSGPP